MNLLEQERLIIPRVNRIGTVFPENKLSLVLALPGSGKTTTTLKALIADDIRPIWFNLDHSATSADTDRIDQFGAEHLMRLLMLRIEDIAGKTVVIDTYERLEEIVGLFLVKNNHTVDNLQLHITNLLEALSDTGVTVIVLAHPEDYVGRDGIFKDNKFLARRCYELISMEAKLTTAQKELKNGTKPLYITYVKKGRAYEGERILVEWMRGDKTTDGGKESFKLDMNTGEIK